MHNIHQYKHFTVNNSIGIPHLSGHDTKPKEQSSKSTDVSFSPLSEVVLIDDNSSVPSSEKMVSFNTTNRAIDSNRHSKNNTTNNNNAKNNFDIYCANITSLSDHAMEYLFKDCNKYHIWSLLETRLVAQNISKFKNDFKNKARQFHATPADETSSSESGGMAHGGELIAPMAHLNITPIDPSVYKYIESYTGAPLRICATYVRLQKLTFLFANAYF